MNYLSVDPAMRGLMNESNSYTSPIKIGAVMRALGAGQVVESNHESLLTGDYITGAFGVQEYAVIDGKELFIFDTKMLPIPTYLDTLWM